MVFLTSEENRIVILLTTWPPSREGAKGYLAFMSNRKRVSPIKKHEKQRKTALTHYLGQITEKQMV